MADTDKRGTMTMPDLSLPGTGSPLRHFPTTNMERMYALDEAWNARDWDTFDAYHDPDHVAVYWPERQSTPTLGGRDHRTESVGFCRAFPDNKVKHPYDLLFGEDDCTCFVTRFTGTFGGPLELPDGSSVQPTGKAFDVLFSTTARWRNGRIVEEYLFYDSATFMKQIGLA